MNVGGAEKYNLTPRQVSQPFSFFSLKKEKTKFTTSNSKYFGYKISFTVSYNHRSIRDTIYSKLPLFFVLQKQEDLFFKCEE
jgi:hypothetical protein